MKCIIFFILSCGHTPRYCNALQHVNVAYSGTVSICMYSSYMLASVYGYLRSTIALRNVLFNDAVLCVIEFAVQIFFAAQREDLPREWAKLGTPMSI